MLACGVTSTGTISPLDLHMWQFPAKAGDRVILHVLWTGGDLFPYVRVRGPDVTTTVVEQTSRNGVLEFTAEQEGTYTILIRDYNIADTGTYEITRTLIGGCPPDLVASVVVDPNVIAKGQDARIRCTVVNAGDVNAPSTRLRAYICNDPNCLSNDPNHPCKDPNCVERGTQIDGRCQSRR